MNLSRKKISLRKWFFYNVIGINTMIIISIIIIGIALTLLTFKKSNDDLDVSLDVISKIFQTVLQYNDRSRIELVSNSIAKFYNLETLALCSKDEMILQVGLYNPKMCVSGDTSVSYFRSNQFGDRGYYLTLKKNNYNYFKPFIIFSFIFLALILISFFGLRRVIFKLQKDIVVPMTSNIEKNGFSHFDAPIIEFQNIFDALGKSYLLEATKHEAEARITISQKVAHDIRSPISTLNLVSSKINDPEIKAIQLAVVEQINNIANGLLSNVKEIYRTNSLDSSLPKSIFSLFQDLKKEYEFKSKALKRDIVFNYTDDEALKTHISVDLHSTLYRSINNFIQNSIEATKKNDKIDVSVSKANNTSAIIQIMDYGRGVPEHILTQLGSCQITYGKETNSFNSGSGIAVLNAKNDLSILNCELKIESELNKFTRTQIFVNL